MSHRALFDLGRTSVYAVCDALVCDHHCVITHVNRSDILIFFFFLSVSNLFYVLSLEHIHINGTQIIQDIWDVCSLHVSLTNYIELHPED